jgi:SAM-dependent methyltransferase
VESTTAPVPLDAYMQTTFRHAPYRPLGKDRIDVLIAGCGTGQHAIETAQRFAGADVLAVDLSAASLGYALDRTRALGLSNIRYAVADILNLDRVGRAFDVIEANGVLHHCADPLAAWRGLLRVLRPGGVMNVGVYSELARAFVVRIRAFIAANGYSATADGIRRCRADMAGHAADPAFRQAMDAADFFSMSECRDLLFHVQEQRLTLPQIARFIDAEGLMFLGFDADTALLGDYAARFPADTAKTDLSCWHVFETERPASFAGMYQFWVQKPLVATSRSP